MPYRGRGVFSKVVQSFWTAEDHPEQIEDIRVGFERIHHRSSTRLIRDLRHVAHFFWSCVWLVHFVLRGRTNFVMENKRDSFFARKYLWSRGTSEENNICNHAFLRVNFAKFGYCFILGTTFGNTLSCHWFLKRPIAASSWRHLEPFFPCTFWCKLRLLLRLEDILWRRTLLNMLSFNFCM